MRPYWASQFTIAKMKKIAWSYMEEKSSEGACVYWIFPCYFLYEKSKIVHRFAPKFLVVLIISWEYFRCSYQRVCTTYSHIVHLSNMQLILNVSMSCYYFVELLFFVTIMDEGFFVSYYDDWTPLCTLCIYMTIRNHCALHRLII